MIEIFNILNTFDLLFDYAQKNNCALIYFYNENIKNCNDEKLAQIFEFYAEFLPEDLVENLKQGVNNTVKHLTTDSAIMNAIEWFPAVDHLPDSDYYWHCYVISPEGDFEYENIVIKPKPEEPTEGS
jgi:hypothetical protein